MIPRVPEPPPADPRAEADLYRDMDHSVVNQSFVDDFLAGTSMSDHAGSTDPAAVDWRVIDLGCGPADIAIRLCQANPHAEVMAVDNEIEMLEIAKIEIDVAGMLDRISLHHADITAMRGFQDGMADAVISNSVIHHLDDPATGLATAFRLTRPGGRLFVRDLFRPETVADIRQLVDTHADGEPEAARELLRQSLHAALTLDEIQNIAGGLGIESSSVQMTSDRHWTLDWTRPA